jgi:hypothetical protein
MPLFLSVFSCPPFPQPTRVLRIRDAVVEQIPNLFLASWHLKVGGESALARIAGEADYGAAALERQVESDGQRRRILSGNSTMGLPSLEFQSCACPF